AEERVQRRLATILAADVVGSSRLIEEDEAGTLATLKSRRREGLEPLVAKHQGRVFKITGDRALGEFASAVNAVQCAVDLQRAPSSQVLSPGSTSSARPWRFGSFPADCPRSSAAGPLSRIQSARQMPTSPPSPSLCRPG